MVTKQAFEGVRYADVSLKSGSMTTRKRAKILLGIPRGGTVMVVDSPSGVIFAFGAAFLAAFRLPIAEGV